MAREFLIGQCDIRCLLINLDEPVDPCKQDPHRRIALEMQSPGSRKRASTILMSVYLPLLAIILFGITRHELHSERDSVQSASSLAAVASVHARKHGSQSDSLQIG